jgi:mono/diheme cytochrome c family protein/glucose/arabinose dehydrogenase
MGVAPHRRGANWVRSIDRCCSRCVLLAALAYVVTPAGAWGQNDPMAPPEQPAESGGDDEASLYQSGLVARYTGSDGVGHVRLEEQLAFAWGADPPDRRVPQGPFKAEFRGHLQIRSPGIYRLRVFAAGTLRLVLDGKTLLDSRSREPAWLDAEPVELPFGYLPLEVRYRRVDESARLALFWEGPQFDLEPISGRWLFHETSKTPADGFERGERLMRALRCAACHDFPGEPTPLAAPALNRLAGNLSRSWLVDRLGGATEAKTPDRTRGRMPHFGFAPSEAKAVADYLFATSDAIDHQPPKAAPLPPQPAKKKKKDEDPPTPPPSAAAGAALFRSVGCLACHRVGELGSDGLFGGGDLANIADKRPADFFARWLTDPAAINRDHRMPVFALEVPEVESLALYLQTLRASPSQTSLAPAKLERIGRELVRQAGCAGCHALPQASGVEAVKPRSKLDPANLEGEIDNCLGAPDGKKFRPGYQLATADRQAVVTFMGATASAQNAPVQRSGKDVLVERNCLACHARGQSRGLAALVPTIIEADPALRELAPALTPPALVGVGDKLRDEALGASIAVLEPRRQPWLRVRMPKFPLTDGEAKTLVKHLIDEDRIPDRPGRASLADSANGSTVEAAGARLVTADGFGCTSCHAIGKWTPQKVAPGAEGSDLSLVGNRIRRAWFDRWIRNPARIVPQMEMPSVQQSVRGVLEGNLEGQLAAVWQVLNRPGFTPPSPSALRVVRRSNLAAVVEPAAVLTDVIEVDGREFVKPLAIGMPNRHNVLFDLATNRLAAWWIGDTARQQTRGKSWHWEAGIPQLLAAAKPDPAAAESELRLVEDGAHLFPVADGQYLTEFDAFEHVSGRIRFSHRLHFRVNEQLSTVQVRQEFTPLANEPGQSGFRRRYEINQVPGGGSCELVTLAGAASIDEGGRIATLDGPTRLQVELRSQAGARLVKSDRGAIVMFSASNQQPLACTLDYRAALVADEFAPPPQPDRSLARQELKVVPGFDAVRLPVTDQAMPTGLAWRSDGTMVVSSLEGRVWLAHDTDGDSLEDRLVPFSDELAAPYGVCAAAESIDVINKYGLLRLTDTDGDSHADRTQLLASGWGHTRDYHDWAVGLPRDSEGNYYMSLPCQQDERTEVAANLRGSIIKLVRRQQTAADPREFSIEPVCGGLRFPQGMALSSAGDLFVTDNQGNYTPFNELNHVVKGARYGFINRLESQSGLSPPFRPAAVEIPHPWTRSVNGICFLEAPPLAREPFGPFAGHLIGCEYDTRRLVRMSLERVADDWQGAVYPFSRDPAAGEETFEGPLVCQVSPGGDIYVGNVRDSGWGAGSNTGSLVRLRPSGQLPPGIAEVRIQRDGFAIDFTSAVDRAKAANPANYAISSYRRIPTPAYGGPDQDRRVETIASAHVSDDAQRASIRLDGLREGFVYEIHVRSLVDGLLFFPAEAYYTLRHRVR